MLQYAHRYATMHASVIQRDTVLLLSSTAVAPHSLAPPATATAV